MLNSLSTRQKNKLIKHYKTDLANLEIGTDNIIRLKGGSNSIRYFKKNIIIPEDLNSIWVELKKVIKPDSILVLKNRDPKIKSLSKLLTGEIPNQPYTLLLLNSDSIITGHKHVSQKEYKKQKLTGDGLGSFFNGITSRITSGLGNLYNLSTEATESIPYKNSNKMPDSKTAYNMESRAYSENETSTEPWVAVLRNKYLVIYKNDNLKSVCVAVRGTKPSDPVDLVADIRIALGRLENSTRYQNDKKVIIGLQKEAFKPSDWWWCGVGHSLGGAIVDELIEDNLIKEGISFNPAIQKEYYDLPTTNRRIYLDSDPLYKVMGRFTKYKEVRKDESDNSMLDAHGLQNFVGGKSLNRI